MAAIFVFVASSGQWTLALPDSTRWRAKPSMASAGVRPGVPAPTSASDGSADSRRAVAFAAARQSICPLPRSELPDLFDPGGLPIGRAEEAEQMVPAEDEVQVGSRQSLELLHQQRPRRRIQVQHALDELQPEPLAFSRGHRQCRDDSRTHGLARRADRAASRVPLCKAPPVAARRAATSSSVMRPPPLSAAAPAEPPNASAIAAWAVRPSGPSTSCVETTALNSPSSPSVAWAIRFRSARSDGMSCDAANVTIEAAPRASRAWNANWAFSGASGRSHLTPSVADAKLRGPHPLREGKSRSSSRSVIASATHARWPGRGVGHWSRRIDRRRASAALLAPYLSVL